MRISSINVAQPRNVMNQNLKAKNVQNPNFRGRGGAWGTLGGALIGLGVTVLSGGTLFWTVPVISGLSGIGGDIYEKSK